MSKTVKASLVKALRGTYWSVDEAMGYLTSPQKNNLPVVIKNDCRPDEASEWHRDELYSLWCDTDHSQKPRYPNKSSDQLSDEFKVSYFIQWAASKGLRIAWLPWAIEKKFLPPDIEQRAILERDMATSQLQLSNKKERSYQIILAALMHTLNIDWGTRTANSELRKLVDEVGEKIGEDAVRSVLKDLIDEEIVNVILIQMRNRIDVP